MPLFSKLVRRSRKALPGLGALKTSLEILNKASSSVPPLQMVVETSLEIIACVEVCAPLSCILLSRVC